MVDTPQPGTPGTSHLVPRASPLDAGFTLLELLIVMVIIATLAAIAVPAYTRNVQAAKEAVLKEDLHVMRQAIDSYTVDKQKAPQSLQDLVQAGYLKSMPKDPITNRTDTWMTTQSDTLNSIDQTASGIDGRSLRGPAILARGHLLQHLVIFPPFCVIPKRSASRLALTPAPHDPHPSASNHSTPSEPFRRILRLNPW